MNGSGRDIFQLSTLPPRGRGASTPGSTRTASGSTRSASRSTRTASGSARSASRSTRSASGSTWTASRSTQLASGGTRSTFEGTPFTSGGTRPACEGIRLTSEGTRLTPEGTCRGDGAHERDGDVRRGQRLALRRATRGMKCGRNTFALRARSDAIRAHFQGPTRSAFSVVAHFAIVSAICCSLPVYM